MAVVTILASARGRSLTSPEPTVEWWVGNARHPRILRLRFGFRHRRGPETGRDRISYVLTQGEIRSSSQRSTEPPTSPSTCAATVTACVPSQCVADARGACIAWWCQPEPPTNRDDHGAAACDVAAYGDMVHARGRDVPRCVPARFEAAPVPFRSARRRLRADHISVERPVGGVGRLAARVGLGELQHFDENAISTEFSALRSTVVWNGDRVVQPINEPAEGRRQSQIAEYLDYYDSPGVQHLALRTEDIVATVSALRERGIRLLHVPADYYEPPLRMAGLDVDLPWSSSRSSASSSTVMTRVTSCRCSRRRSRAADRVPSRSIQREGARLRRRQLQGAVPVDRGRAGPAWKPLSPTRERRNNRDDRNRDPGRL
jgi:4-hydroxyphenylpyruvate dioxygenase